MQPIKDTRGNKVNTGKAVVKINDKTFGRVNVTRVISYKLNLTPDIFGKYDYKVTFVYGENDNYNAGRNNTILTVTGFQPVVKVKATNNTYAGDIITVTVNITNKDGYSTRSGNVGNQNQWCNIQSRHKSSNYASSKRNGYI